MGILNWFRNKETRSTFAQPTSWLSTAFGGTATASGQVVTVDSSLREPAVFACVRVISEDVASLPCKIYQKGSDGDREQISSHPVARLFQVAPNPEMSVFSYVETMQQHLLLYGNAYSEIERNGIGDPIALWILKPSLMRIKIVDGAVIYEYDNRMSFESDKILHIRGMSSDGILGLSPIQYMRETIGGLSAMSKAGNKFFANASRPSGVLSHPAKLSEDAAKRLRQGWDGMYSGLSDNIGRTAILEEGMRFDSMSIPHSDAQWIEAKAFALQDIARIYRIPPHMIGDLSRSSFSNIESQQISYMQQTVMPWTRRWSAEINRSLLKSDDNSIFSEFLAEEMLRGNTTERFDAYRTARETGWMSVNEIRQKENMPKLQSPAGDSYIQPLNFADTEIAKEMQTPDAERQNSTAIIRNSSNRKANKLGEDEWREGIALTDEALCSKVLAIMESVCNHIEGLDARSITEQLIESWQFALSGVESRKQCVDACENWANSFMKQESCEVLIQRSIKDD